MPYTFPNRQSFSSGEQASWSSPSRGTALFRLILGAVVPVLLSSPLLRGQTSASRAVGQTPGLGLASEAEGGDYILGSLRLSTSFTDNVLASDVHPVSDVDYAVQPGFSFAKTLGWLHTDWDFSPGLVKYQRISQRDRWTGAVVTNFDARPWEHWLIRVRNNYRVRTNPPFDTFNTKGPVDFFTGEGGGLILPLAEQISDEGNVDISYQPTETTTLQLSGFFRDYIYHPIHGTNISAGLVNSTAQAGRGQIYRRVSERAYLGAAYSLQDINFAFSNHTAGVLTQSVVGVGTFDITPAMELQIFAGPEYSKVRNQLLVNLGLVSVFIPVTEKVVSGTGGIIYTLHKDRTSLQLAGIRQVSGGPGLTAGAHSTKADFTVRRELGSHWYAELSAEYGIFTPIGLSTTSFDIHAVSGRAALEHRLSEHLSFELDFSHGHQQEVAEAHRRRVDVNFAMISLKYQIKRPLD